MRLLVLCGAVAVVACGSEASAPELPTTDEMMDWIETTVARGIRRPGYPADAETEVWAAEQLRRLGVEDVRLEPVPTTRWEPRGCAVTIGAGDSLETLDCFPAPYTTPTAGVEGTVVVDSFDTTRDGSPLRGAIALYDNAPTALPQAFLRDRIATAVHDPEGAFDQPHTLPFGGRQTGVLLPALEAGALAFIGIAPNAWAGGDQYYVPYDGGDWRIPAVWISRARGDRIRELLAAGPVTARVSYDAVREPATANNVVGVLPGRSAEWMIIASHHDAPWASAVEDGSGIALVLAQAQYWAKVPREQRPFSLLFLLTGGHFSGASGTIQFLADHRDIVDTTVLALHLEHVAREAELVGSAAVPLDAPTTRWWFTSQIPVLEEKVAAMVRGRDLRRSAILRPTALGDMPPTDGAYLYPASVPVVQLLAAPAYLFEPVDTPMMVHAPSLVPISEGVIDLIRGLDGQTAAGMRAAMPPADTTPLPGAVRCGDGSGACRNDADCAIIAGRDVSMVSRGCAIACANASDTVSCALSCVADRAGVSTGCTVCYLTESQCALGPCLERCALTGASEDCRRCRVREGCYNALTSCGLTTGP